MTQTRSQGTEQAPKLSEEEQKAMLEKWAPEQLVKVQKYCFNNGITFRGVNEQHCMSLPPHIGIWYIQTASKDESYWAISGDFPTDIAPVNVAKDARDAIRYFALSWQLKAARMEDSLAEGKIPLSDKDTQQKAIFDLIHKAEILANIHRDERLWEGTNLKIA